MTLRSRSSGAWAVIPDGGLRFKGTGLWVSPTKVYVRSGGQWVDTKYKPSVGQPVVSISNASLAPLSLVVAWTVPVTGVAPTSYKVSLYSSADALVSTQTVPSTVLTATFGASVLTADTNYYVLVSGIAAGAANGVSAKCKVRTGHPLVTVTETTYGWNPVEQSVRPTGVGEVSYYGDTYRVGAAVDVGDPSAGPLSAWGTAWVSAGYDSQTGIWEGVDFTIPDANRLITRIALVTDPNHSLYLGIKRNGTWVQGYTAFSLGILAAGSAGASSEYTRILDHDYVAVSPTVVGSPNIKQFALEDRGINFSEVDGLAIGVTNFVNLYGNPATTTGSKRINVPFPTDSKVVGRYLPYIVDAVKRVVGVGDVVTGYSWVSPLGVSPTRTLPIPPTAVWPISGSTAWVRLELITANDIRYRVYLNGIAQTGTNQYLKDSNGVVIVETSATIFPAGSLGSYTTAVTSTAATASWRASIQDVVVYYRDQVPTGTNTRVITPAVSTVSSPSAW